MVTEYIRRSDSTRAVSGHIRKPTLARYAIEDIRARGVQTFTTRYAYVLYLRHVDRPSDEISLYAFSHILKWHQVEFGIQIVDREAHPVVWGWR